jgi:hypothetical protein
VRGRVEPASAEPTPPRAQGPDLARRSPGGTRWRSRRGLTGRGPVEAPTIFCQGPRGKATSDRMALAPPHQFVRVRGQNATLPVLSPQTAGGYRGMTKPGQIS